MTAADQRNETAIVRPLDLSAGLAGTAGQDHYAIVDIGSNSVRMVVYDQLGRAPLPRYIEKSLCRLGDGLAQTGAIAPEGFRRTVDVSRERLGARLHKLGYRWIGARPQHPAQKPEAIETYKKTGQA